MKGSGNVFSDVAAFMDRAMNYTGGDMPEQLAVQQVSESFFRVYGSRIIRGWPFTPQEDLPRRQSRYDRSVRDQHA